MCNPRDGMRIRTMETPKSTYNTALNLQARREHSKAELLHKLTARGLAKEEAQQAIAKLVANNLQSDERFAENYINARKNHGFGPLRIEAELLQRGVAAEIIAKQFAAANINWCEIAREVFRKKFGPKMATDFLTQMKQKHFLQYKGFDVDTIKQL
jgi:regulatory protein